MNQRPAAYDFVRYLTAKRTVDDRALNPHVWAAMAAAAADRARHVQPLQVLEIGAGVGTMIERAAAWSLCPGAAVNYLAIDAEPANIAAAQARLEAAQARLEAAQARLEAAQARLEALPPAWSVQVEQADLFDFVRRPAALHRYDLLIANAFLDLVDIPQTLPLLRRLLQPGGLFYFTITFDGATILQPVIDPAFDAQVEAVYHRTMDERITAGQRSGDSRSGRHLFGHLVRAGFDLRAAGASDWVVHPVAGHYPADEAYFLHFIVHTMQDALQSRAELDPGQLTELVETRHRQVEQGELVYIAHQLDVFGVCPAA